MVEVDYKKQGKTNRLRGQIFETRVREDLETKGWIVTKWMNTVDFERDKVAPSKRKYNPFTKALSIGTGFPDLLCFKKNGNLFEVLGVEVKTNGSLDKFEKGQCIWYLEKGIIPKILIARKKKDEDDSRKIAIHYEDFREKYMEKKAKLDKKKK
ncbi:hypothetical protein GW932_04040 [archaeon]|nr:hypothetical protein [archaeon]